MAIPVWICSTVEKNDSAINSVFATTLHLVQNDSSHHPKLQIAAARLLSRLISGIKDNNVLHPLFVDPSFKYLPKEVCIMFPLVE